MKIQNILKGGSFECYEKSLVIPLELPNHSTLNFFFFSFLSSFFFFFLRLWTICNMNNANRVQPLKILLILSPVCSSSDMIMIITKMPRIMRVLLQGSNGSLLRILQELSIRFMKRMKYWVREFIQVSWPLISNLFPISTRESNIPSGTYVQGVSEVQSPNFISTHFIDILHMGREMMWI